MNDRHTLTLTTRIAVTDTWILRHGATWEPGDPDSTDIVVHQPGQPDLTVHLGDTLTWDGHTINVEARERP